jgi:hypothetical protein
MPERPTEVDVDEPVGDLDEGDTLPDVGSLTHDVENPEDDVAPPEPPEDDLFSGVDTTDEPVLPSCPPSPVPTPPPARTAPVLPPRNPARPYSADLPQPTLLQLKIAMEFIKELEEATLENTGMPANLEASIRDRIRNPLQEAFRIDDRDHRLCLDIYLATQHTSRATYEWVCRGVQRHTPTFKPISWDKMERQVKTWTGIDLIKDDMCIKGCIGYTGPYRTLDRCPYPKCGEHRYDQEILRVTKGQSRIPRRQFYSLLVGPQLQAQWTDPETARAMRYAANKMREMIAQAKQTGCVESFDDFTSGSALLERFHKGLIGEDDIMLLFSADGAQLYRHKDSDMWMATFTILNLPPDMRYKMARMLPQVFIPGPNKPKHMDSFLFRTFHHLSALMKEGLKIWDAAQNRLIISQVHLIFAAADGPGLTSLDGGVGHSGACGCRLHCPHPGRLQVDGTHYYPALQLPHGYARKVPKCAHGDIDPADVADWDVSDEDYLANLSELLSSRTQTAYKAIRLKTGLVKPSIFLGFPASHTLGIPGIFTIDMMHLPALNIPDLMLKLWRGTLEHAPGDDPRNWPWAEFLRDLASWRAHGAEIGDARPFFPTWFERAPRNPAEKLTSGYKAWEFLHYMFGMGPAVFRSRLPEEYWTHYCKLVRAIQIHIQRTISKKELQEATDLINKFADEFETLYVQRASGRIPFVRPWLHTLLHLANEVMRVGPSCYYTQWTLERAIGFLTADIRLHSEAGAYANLAHIAMRRSQINALSAMIPDLLPPTHPLPYGAIDLKDGYSLHRARDTTARPVSDPEALAIQRFMVDTSGEAEGARWSDPSIFRWARLALPNGSIARSAWKETLKPIEKLRTSRMVEVC